MSEYPVLDENGYFFGTSASMHELIETWANGGTTEDFLSQHQDVSMEHILSFVAELMYDR